MVKSEPSKSKKAVPKKVEPEEKNDGPTYPEIKDKGMFEMNGHIYRVGYINSAWIDRVEVKLDLVEKAEDR